MTVRPLGRFATRVTRFFGHAAGFVVVSVLAGVLVAGLALPFAAGIGMAARQGAESFQSVQVDDLTIQPLPGRSQMVASDGSLIATFYEQNREEVPLSEVAPVMQQALVSVEDSRFYEHGPVDLRGVLRAALANFEEGDVAQGASTLTMQYARNLLIQHADTREEIGQALAVTQERKIEEIKYAIALEEKYSKDQILEGYLNTVYFGHSSYGIDIAARNYFGVRASALNLPQAALLAGLVQSPIAYDPTRNMDVATDRRNVVLDRMVVTGAIKQEQADAAKASPVTLKLAPNSNGCIASTAPFFCDYAYRWLLTQPELGATVDAREQLLRSGHVTIKTTMNPIAQTAAQQAISARIEPSNLVAGAEAVVQPGTGQVQAIATSRGFGEGEGKTTVNYAVDKQFGESSGFQAGSTFKIFTLTAALEKGVTLYDRFPGTQTTYTDFHNCSTGATEPPYSPANSTSAGANPTIMEALAASVNSAFVGLEEQITQCAAANMATRFGMTDSDGSPVQTNPSFTLGTDTVSPLRMAEAVATLAANGNHCVAYPIAEVLDRDNQPLLTPKPNCAQVVDPKWAAAANYALQGVMLNGTGAPVKLDRVSAGKTGTTDRNIAVWFVGFTPNLAAAVWAGNPDSFDYPLDNVTIGGQFYGEVHGFSLPGPIWHDTMENTLATMPVVDFPEPPTEALTGRNVTVPEVRGLSRDEATARLTAAGLRWTVESGRFFSDYPSETVAMTDPGGGASVSPRTTVRIYISGGPQVTTPPTVGGGGGGGGGGGTGTCKPGRVCPPDGGG